MLLSTQVLHPGFYRVLLVLGPCFCLVGATLTVIDTFRRGELQDEYGNRVLRTNKTWRFYLSATSLVVVLIACQAFMVGCSILGWNRFEA